MNTKQKIEIMEAWEDGKDVEWAYRLHNFSNLLPKDEEPDWDWVNKIYRIKENPEDVYKQGYLDGLEAYAYSTGGEYFVGCKGTTSLRGNKTPLAVARTNVESIWNYGLKSGE